MNSIVKITLSFAALALTLRAEAEATPIDGSKVEILEVGVFCGPAAAPVGPGGSWTMVDDGKSRKCPEGTSCRKSACNCDDLPDGTVMSHSWDYEKETRSCRRIGGQKCTAKEQCVYGADCVSGVCKCDHSDPEIRCPEKKDDIVIMHRK